MSARSQIAEVQDKQQHRSDLEIKIANIANIYILRDTLLSASRINFLIPIFLTLFSIQQKLARFYNTLPKFTNIFFVLNFS